VASDAPSQAERALCAGVQHGWVRGRGWRLTCKIRRRAWQSPVRFSSASPSAAVHGAACVALNRRTFSMAIHGLVGEGPSSAICFS
jgi:hypothetical protein